MPVYNMRAVTHYGHLIVATMIGAAASISIPDAVVQIVSAGVLASGTIISAIIARSAMQRANPRDLPDESFKDRTPIDYEDENGGTGKA